MITIDDLLIKHYLYAIDTTSFYNRYIFKIADITKIGKVDKQDEYTLVTCDGARYKLYEDDVSGKITLYTGNKLLTVQEVTNNIVTFLKVGDTIVYNMPNAPPIEAKVVRYDEKYGRRILIEVLGSRHPSSKVFARYGQANITAIITADMRKAMAISI